MAPAGGAGYGRWERGAIREPSLNDQQGLAPFTQREMRDALATFATGVTIVTATKRDGTPVGMTASSFNSVSLDPPLVLWSVTRKALSAETFRDAERFAVHVLGERQTSLATLFARSGADKFSGTPWRPGAGGVPRLDDFVARFDCRRFAVHPGGDHWVVIGEVVTLERGRPAAVGRPLVYHAGGYATSRPVPLPATAPTAAAPEAEATGT